MSSNKNFGMGMSVLCLHDTHGYTARLRAFGQSASSMLVTGGRDVRTTDTASSSPLSPTTKTLLAIGRGAFTQAQAFKAVNGGLAVIGIQEFSPDTPFAAAIESAYADLLQNRFALSVGMVGDKGFVLTGERGLALATTPQDLVQVFYDLLQSRIGQHHNKTILNRVEAFPAAVEDDCNDLFARMREWEKLALFPSYQAKTSEALYPDAEFGFVAKRTAAGTLVTARASNKTAPSAKDITLITDVDKNGTVSVESLGRKASLNGPLAHLIFAARPDVDYIVHSHVMLPEGVNAPSPSAPGTAADWAAIAPAITSGAEIVNQPYHGCLILLRDADDLLPLLKRQSLYQAQSALYDAAYARFQATPEKQTGLERMVATLNIPKNAAVLDLCCGTGASTKALTGMGFTHVDFADGAGGMLAVAEQRLGRKGTLVRLETLGADAAGLPCAHYDLVTMRQAFNYVAAADMPALFNNIANLVAPSGHFVFNSFMPLADGIDRRQNSSEHNGVIALTSEINAVSGSLIRHAQRSEIIDTVNGQWHPILDINEFHQHAPADVVRALQKAGFVPHALIKGASVCYHATKRPHSGRHP